MRQFYEQWCEHIIRQPMAGELQRPDLQEDINRQPMAGEMQLAVTHLNFQPSTGCRHARKTSEGIARCGGFERIVVW